MLSNVTAVIVNILSNLLIFLMGALVLDVAWQVFTRFILQNPSAFTEELAGFLLIWIGLLGSSYALYTRAHLGIDILTSKLVGTRRMISETVVWVTVITFAALVLVTGGLQLVILTFTLKQVSPAMAIPMGYVYMVLPSTGALMIYFSAVNIYYIVTRGSLEIGVHASQSID